MRNTKAIFAGTLTAAMLALGGGLAYASTTSDTPAAPTRPAVTTTVPAHAPHNQARHGYCGWQSGDHRCDWHGYGYQHYGSQLGRSYQRHGVNGHQRGSSYQRSGYSGQGWGNGGSRGGGW